MHFTCGDLHSRTYIAEYVRFCAHFKGLMAFVFEKHESILICLLFCRYRHGTDIAFGAPK